MKPLQEYHRPDKVWVQKTDSNTFITDLDANDPFRNPILFDVIRLVLGLSILTGGYQTLERYYLK